jgi:hypothetical protein
MQDERQDGEENTEELLIRTEISAFTGISFNHRQIPLELSAGKDFSRENFRKPTQTYPGTEERIQVYIKRSELNLPIFNHLDKKVNDGFDTEIS